MSEKNLPAFNISPEKVIAKIHLEALKNVPDRYKLFNTGIVNMNALSHNDFNTGKFDIYGNESGVYEIGVMFDINVRNFSRWQQQIKTEVAHAVKTLHNYLLVFAGPHKAKHITINDVFCFVSKKPDVRPEQITKYSNYTLKNLCPENDEDNPDIVYGIPVTLTSNTTINGFTVICKYKIDHSNM